MAHIRKSYNDLEEKLQKEKRAYYGRVQEHIEKRKKEDRLRRMVWYAIGLILTILLVWMICGQNTVRDIQRQVTDLLSNKSSEALSLDYIFEIPESVSAIPFLLRLLPGLLLVLLRFLWAMVLLMASWIPEKVLVLLLYAIPAAGPIILGRTWYDAKNRVYSVETEAEDPFVRALCDGRDVAILQAGVDGERAALDCLAELNDHCYIFTNLHIPCEDRESETDIIAVTPAGITIVEVKNYASIIRGDTADHDLKQDKGRNDDYGDNNFYNPIKQVATHARHLASYLRSNNLPVYVKTCVFFVNPGAELQLRDSKGIMRGQCPVFHVDQTENLLRYLQSSSNHLSNREYEQSIKLLEKLMQ